MKRTRQRKREQPQDGPRNGTQRRPTTRRPTGGSRHRTAGEERQQDSSGRCAHCSANPLPTGALRPAGRAWQGEDKGLWGLAYWDSLLVKESGAGRARPACPGPENSQSFPRTSLQHKNPHNWTHTHTHNASDCHSLPSHRRVLLARPLEKTPWQISRNQTLPIRLVLGESAGTGGTAGAKEVRTHGQPLSPHLCLRWIRYSRAWGLQFCVCGFFSFFFNLWVGIRSHLLLGNILIPTLTLFLRKLKVGKTQGVEKKEGSKLGD